MCGVHEDQSILPITDAFSLLWVQVASNAASSVWEESPTPLWWPPSSASPGWLCSVAVDMWLLQALWRFLSNTSPPTPGTMLCWVRCKYLLPFKNVFKAQQPHDVFRKTTVCSPGRKLMLFMKAHCMQIGKKSMREGRKNEPRGSGCLGSHLGMASCTHRTFHTL